MMIVLPKKHMEVSDEMRRRLYCAIWDYSDELGIPHVFFLDSQTIQNAMDNIATRVAELSLSVRLDKNLIEMKKESKKFKTEMESMGKVERRLRKSKKSKKKSRVVKVGKKK
ncbi:MAG: hypothetical protein PVI03_04625 [Candidatus Thorarchaeota archaeon]